MVLKAIWFLNRVASAVVAIKFRYVLSFFYWNLDILVVGKSENGDFINKSNDVRTVDT